jgi:hypothetical protein
MQFGREISFNNSGNNIGRWPLGSYNQVDPDRPCQLGKPGQRCFNFTASRHNQIGKFINDQYNIGQVPVPLFRAKPSGQKFCIILLFFRTLAILAGHTSLPFQ